MSIYDNYIYFITVGDLVKIGCSAYPELRLRTIGRDLPGSVHLAAQFVGTFSQESDLHFMLRDDWFSGEWFYLTPRIQKIIENANAGTPPKIPPRSGPTPARAGRGGRKKQRVEMESGGAKKGSSAGTNGTGPSIEQED